MYFSGKFATMKKTLYILLTYMLVMAGCNEPVEFTLKGQLNNLPSDTLLVYHQIPESRIDTIFCQNGTFQYTFTPDTFTVFSLILNSQEALPIFAEKGQTVEVKSSATGLTIKGEGENERMNNIIGLLRNTAQDEIIAVVDSLILEDPYSFTNLYLIDKYYVQDEQPDYTKIQKLIDQQSGIIKDTPYIVDLQAKLNAINEKNKNQSIYTMYGHDRQGKTISWNKVRDKYILIDFWASWHPQSVIEQDSLVNVLKELKNEKFVIYSHSLDLDKEAWLKASDRDTTQWHQVCDLKGWNNNIIKNQGIETLPANLLLDKNKRIIARDIRGKELVEKIKELTKKDREQAKKKSRK